MTNDNPTLHEYVVYYMQLLDGSEGYRQQMRFTVMAVERWQDRTLHLSDLSEELINDYLAAIKETLSPATRLNRRNMLLRLWRHAAFDRALSNPPEPPNGDTITKVKCPAMIPVAWSQAEVEQLLAVVAGLRGCYGRNGTRIHKAGYWTSYIRAAWDSGMRGCDLRPLRRDQVGKDGRISLVQQKTGHVVVAQFRDTTIEAIDDFMCGDDRELIWPLWCNIETWRTIVRKLVAKAGLKGSIGYLRRSSGTACELANPGEGYKFLGNSPQVFYSRYWDPSQAPSIPQPPELMRGAP